MPLAQSQKKHLVEQEFTKAHAEPGSFSRRPSCTCQWLVSERRTSRLRRPQLPSSCPSLEKRPTTPSPPLHGCFPPRRGLWRVQDDEKPDCRALPFLRSLPHYYRARNPSKFTKNIVFYITDYSSHLPISSGLHFSDSHIDQIATTADYFPRRQGYARDSTLPPQPLRSAWTTLSELFSEPVVYFFRVHVVVRLHEPS